MSRATHRYAGHVARRIEHRAGEVQEIPASARIFIASRFPGEDDLVEHRFAGGGNLRGQETKRGLAREVALAQAQAAGQGHVTHEDLGLPVEQKGRRRDCVQEHPQGLLALPQGLFGPLALGNILSDDDQAETAANAYAAGPGFDLDQGAVFSPRHIFADGQTLRLDLLPAADEHLVKLLGA